MASDLRLETLETWVRTLHWASRSGYVIARSIKPQSLRSPILTFATRQELELEVREGVLCLAAAPMISVSCLTRNLESLASRIISESLAMPDYGNGGSHAVTTKIIPILVTVRYQKGAPGPGPGSRVWGSSDGVVARWPGRRPRHDVGSQPGHIGWRLRARRPGGPSGTRDGQR